MNTTRTSAHDRPRPAGASVRAAATAALLLPAALAGGAPAAAASSVRGEDVERADAWPELKGSAKADVRKDIQRLRKAKTFEMGEQARDALIDAGAAVVPLLLPTLGKEKDEAALERIDAVLTSVTGAAHTRLLAETFDDRALAVRVWSLRRAARFPDPGIREAAEGRLVALVGTPEKPARKAADPEELYATSLACAAGGSLAGIEHLFARARGEWKRESEALLAALAGARGDEASRAVLELMGEERKDVVTGLRMLWACGNQNAAVPHIGRFLDSEDHQVRNAAINALRCIVDGDEPLPTLPVFEAIERAKKWKARL